MKRTLLTIAAVVALVALCAAPAFAEGYNDGGINYNYPDGAGGFEPNPSGAYGSNAGHYTRATGYFMGPHGGYTTTTNKCQDCHSTHYATGSYKLLRANSAAAACDYCHGGGGGSSVNIQMDNAYKAAGADVHDGVIDLAAAPNGYGTGHTLGFKGNAPADINPAFSDPDDGLACFSCHSPHGNSARILQAFGSPARPAGPGTVNQLVGVSFMSAQMFRMQESMNIIFDFGDFNQFTGQAYPQDSYMPIPEDLSMLPHDLDGAPVVKWAGAETEIGHVIENSPGNGAVDMSDDPTYMPGDPQDVDGEVAKARYAFYAWMMGPDGDPSTPDNQLPPSPADMQAWATTPGNLGPMVNGKYTVTNQGVGTLFSLFHVQFDGSGNVTNPGQLVPLFMSWKVYWGEDTKAGNIATAFLNMGDNQVTDTNFMGLPTAGGYGPIAPPELEVWHKPLFPKGRFLLLKNPDRGDDVAYSFDPMTGSGTGTNEMGMPSPDSNATFGSPSAPDGKKVAIDWEWPIGPAASWGPFFSTDGNERFPLAFPWAPKGVAMENEMCTSCHDGSAGMSKEVANVWVPNPVDPMDGEYLDVYSHDSNSRGCARAQFLNSDDDDNFGPHCANCHTGASGCRTCHSEDGENWDSFGKGAYDPNETDVVEGVSTYKAPAAVRTRAVAGINGKCLDGGFSYPHRTLGVNMLKDNLWGVNFDGTPVNPGETRTENGADWDPQITADLQSFFADPAGRSFESTAVLGQVAHNLDSVCIDCHGDATYYNEGAYVEFTSYNPLNPSQSWDIKGWNLLLKGLP